MSNYFNNMMFNPQYVNQTYYLQAQQAYYNFEQDRKICDAMKAIRDLCNAVKGMDDSHQKQAFISCLTIIAEEFGWRDNG